jgi:hypothetical protein
MAVTYQGFQATASFSTATTQSTNVTPTNPKGIVVAIAQNVGFGDEVSGVTYGGVAMQRVRFEPALIANTEPGAIYLYFLGSGIPTGTQAVAITSTGTSAKRSIIYAYTAAANTEVVGQAGTQSIGATNPSLSISPTAAGEIAYALHSGLNAPVSTVQAGSSHVGSFDFGNQSAMWARKTVAAAGATTVGYTASSAPYVHAAVAIAEVAGENKSGSATLSGGGTVTASGSKTGQATPTATGSGTLAATGTKATTGAAATSAGGALNSTGARATTGAATLSGGGMLTVTAVKAAATAPTVSGGGTLTAIGAKTAVLPHGTVIGGGGLVSGGEKHARSSAILSGAGNLTAAGTADGGGESFDRAGTAVLTGAGTLAALGIKAGEGSSFLSGAAVLIATGAKQASNAASLSGGGVLTAMGRRRVPPNTRAARPAQALITIAHPPTGRFNRATRYDG